MHTWALFSCSGLLTLTAYNLVASPDTPNMGPEPEPDPNSKSAADEKFTLTDLSSELPETAAPVMGPELPDTPQLSNFDRTVSTARASNYQTSQGTNEKLDLQALLGTRGAPLPASVITSSTPAAAQDFITYRTTDVQPISTLRSASSSASFQDGSSLGVFAHLARERAIAAAAAQRARYPLADAVVTTRPSSVTQPEVVSANPAFTQSEVIPTANRQNLVARQLEVEARQRAALATAPDPATVSDATQQPDVAPAPQSVKASQIAAVPVTSRPETATIPTVPIASTQELPPAPAAAVQSTEATELATVPTTTTQNPEIAELPTVPVPSTQTLLAEQGVEPTVAEQQTQGTELAVVLPPGSRGELFAPLPEASVTPNQMATEVLGDVPPTAATDSPISSALMQTLVMRRQIFTRICEEARLDASAESMPEFCAEVINELAQSIPEAATAGTPIPGEVLSPTRSNPRIGVL